MCLVFMLEMSSSTNNYDLMKKIRGSKAVLLVAILPVAILLVYVLLAAGRLVYVLLSAVLRTAILLVYVLRTAILRVYVLLAVILLVYVLRTAILLVYVLPVAVLFAGEPDCRSTVGGLDYLGQVNTTVTGRTCKPWSSQVTSYHISIGHSNCFQFHVRLFPHQIH